MRLEMTRRTDLALRAMLALDRAEARIKGADLAGMAGTTPGFLAQALAAPIERGWITSEPGPSGGYRLAVPLGGVSVLDLVEASEGATDSGRCVLVGDACAPGDTCALHEPWTRARAALTSELARTPLSEVRHRDLTRTTHDTRPPRDTETPT